MTTYIKRILVALLVTILMMLAFIWGAFAIKERIFPYELAVSIYTKVADPETLASRFETDKLWAERISKGGFILHFRHAQREKWPNVLGFDAYEIYTEANSERSTYSKATCLTDQGMEEAKLIGKVFKINDVNVDKVVSSPSCRAMQTAQLAFGKVDFVDISLLHRTAMMQDQRDHFAHQLRELFLRNSPSQTGNVIFSGHGSTLEDDTKIIFDEDETGGLDRQETGFIVIENVNGKLHARYRFDSISVYVNATLKLPTDAKRLPKPAPPLP